MSRPHTEPSLRPKHPKRSVAAYVFDQDDLAGTDMSRLAVADGD
jgi:hypothetical protein